MSRFSFLVIFFLSLVANCAWGQKGLRMVELNTENFFFPTHDEGKDDTIFMPKSPKRWTWTRYWHKQQNIAKEILGLSHEGVPDLVCLVEVENDSVLCDLTQRSLLRQAGYRYVMTNSKDVRGIDVALLYRPGTFKLLNHRSLQVNFGDLKPMATRDILYVKGKCYTGDLLHVFVCHLSSKLSGAEASEPYRCKEAECLKSAIDSIQKTDANAKIIITGDFNEMANERALTDVLKTREVGKKADKKSLYNLTLTMNLPDKVSGTYKYDGQWEMIDHILVSGSLLKAKGLHTSSSLSGIGLLPFLVVDDKSDNGVLPFRTYSGYRYLGGFSDHLPLWLDLEE